MRRLYPDKQKLYIPGLICPDCGRECAAIPLDNSFDNSGTHCTNGIGGTWYPEDYGTPVSDCCESGLDIDFNDYAEL